MRRLCAALLLTAAWGLASPLALPAQTTVNDAYTLRLDRLSRVVGVSSRFAALETKIGCAVRLKGINAGDKLKVVWTAVDAGEWKNKLLVEDADRTLTADMERVQFAIDSNGLIPGQYKIDIVLNGEIVKTVEFTMIPEAAPQAAQFYALAVTRPVGQPAGGVASRGRVLITRDPGNVFSVGFFETALGGTGSQWRATGWVAPLVSAQLLDVNMSTQRIAYESDFDQVDGPSAGGLTTAAILSALRGEPIRADSAMTGTINPDGTIGPVGGIVHKITGAAAAGKKLVLIPAGGRTQKDLNTQKDVDLVEHGRALGVEVKEVGDIYAAYKLLCGKELPKLAADDAPEISDPQARARIKQKMDLWLQRYEASKADYAGLSENGHDPVFESGLALAAKSAVNVQGKFDEGLAGAAWAKAHRAAILAAITVTQARITEMLRDDKSKQAQDECKKLFDSICAIRLQVDQALSSQKNTTLSELDGVLTGWSWYVKANANLTLAEKQLVAVDGETAEQLQLRLFRAAGSLIIAEAYFRTADDYREIAAGLPGAPLPKEMPLAVVADLFNMAANSNIALLDSVILEPESKRAAVTMDVIRNLFSAEDPMYLEAREFELVGVLTRGSGTDAQQTLALGRSIWAYGASSALIAKYYSLIAIKDKNGTLIGFQKERALANMVDLADTQVRRSITHLKNNNIDATSCVILYEAARQLRDGSAEEKFDALVTYWMAYTQSRALAYLAAGVEPLK